MSEVFDELGERPPPQRVWSATVAKNVADFSDPVEVVIPGLSTELRWTCRYWQSRNDVDLPQRGHACLVNLDDNNEWWMVAWWPF